MRTHLMFVMRAVPENLTTLDGLECYADYVGNMQYGDARRGS